MMRRQRPTIKQLHSMTDAERRAYFATLTIEQMNGDELELYNRQLMDDLRGLLTARQAQPGQPTTTPPTPATDDITWPGELPTKRMRANVHRFDCLDDAGQVDYLRGLWGDL